MVPEKSTFCNGVCRIGGEAEAARFDFVTRNYRDASCLSLIDHHCFFFSLSLSTFQSFRNYRNHVLTGTCLRHWNHALDGAKLAEKKRKKYIDKLENFVGVLQSNEEYLWHGYNWRSAKTLTSNSGNGPRLKGLWVSCFYGSANGIENILYCKMFLNEYCYLFGTEWQKPANFFISAFCA